MSMLSFEKLALKLRVTSVSVALLLIAALLIVLLFQTNDDRLVNSQLSESGQDAQALIQSNLARLEERVTSLKQQVSNVADWQQTKQLLTDNSPSSLTQWQQDLKTLFPELKQACFYSEPVLTPNSACMLLTYVSLSTMRDIEKQSPADLLVVMQQSQIDHVLLAAKVVGATQNQSGIVLMAMKPEAVFNVLDSKLPHSTYIELVQGEAAQRALFSAGAMTLKQSEAKTLLPVAGSHWQLKLWQAPVTVTTNWSLIISVLIVLTIFWVLRERWHSRLLQMDSATLEEQLSDFQQLKLRTRYQLAHKELTFVSQTIQQIALPQRQKPGGQAPPVPEVSESTPIQQDHSVDISEHMPEQESLEEVAEPNTSTSDVIEYEQSALSDIREQSLRAQEKAQSVKYDASEKYMADQDLVATDNESLTLSLDDRVEKTNDEMVLDLDLDEAPDSTLEITEINQLEPEAALMTDLEIDDEAATSLFVPDESIFRKYDIRGVVGEQLTVPVMNLIGKAVGSLVMEQGFGSLNVGHDGRLSSPPLAKAFIRGVLSAGCDVFDLGQVPTPLIYFACHRSAIRCGVMITGSHNPSDHNGIKIVVDGKALAGDEIGALYQRIKEQNFVTGDAGTLTTADVFDDYLEVIDKALTVEHTPSVVVDCGNSVAGNFLPRLLRQVGCNVIELFCDVDGRFPNHHPDPGQPENMQALQHTVKTNNADFGVAVDGDADRLGVVDSNGKIIWPDRVMMAFAKDILLQNPAGTILFDVKCSSLLKQVIEAENGHAIMVPTGHSIIKGKMAEHKAVFAGEMTGHFFFNDRWYGFDDAMYSACRLAELLSKTAATSADFFAEIPENIATPEIIINMPLTEGRQLVQQFGDSYHAEAAEKTELDGVRIDFADGWGLLRVSNTTAAISLRFEAQTQQRLEQIKQSFRDQIKQLSSATPINF